MFVLSAQSLPLAIYSHSCQAQGHMLLCDEAPGAKVTRMSGRKGVASVVYWKDARVLQRQAVSRCCTDRVAERWDVVRCEGVR